MAGPIQHVGGLARAIPRRDRYIGYGRILRGPIPRLKIRGRRGCNRDGPTCDDGAGSQNRTGRFGDVGTASLTTRRPPPTDDKKRPFRLQAVGALLHVHCHLHR